jgi:hypothetical protein
LSNWFKRIANNIHEEEFVPALVWQQRNEGYWQVYCSAGRLLLQRPSKIDPGFYAASGNLSSGTASYGSGF